MTTERVAAFVFFYHTDFDVVCWFYFSVNYKKQIIKYALFTLLKNNS